MGVGGGGWTYLGPPTASSVFEIPDAQVAHEANFSVVVSDSGFGAAAESNEAGAVMLVLQC